MKEKRWKPEKGEMYWYVWNDGNACWGDFTGVSDERRFKSGNCFKTEAEAVAAAEKVKALLLSLQPTCNNLATNLQHKKLPEWCKIGSWVWDERNGYGEIKSVRDDRSACNIEFKGGGGDFVPEALAELKLARLRPYNVDEMKSLVGKVIEVELSEYAMCLKVEGYWAYFLDYCGNDEDDTARIIGYNTDMLKDMRAVDGSPCGCLEHLENGEWVR